MHARPLAVLLLSLLVQSTALAKEIGKLEIGAFGGMDATFAGPAHPSPDTPNVDFAQSQKAGLPSNGIMGLRVKWAGFWKPNVAAEMLFNTDTAQLQLDAWNVGLQGFSVSAWVRGEAAIAGLNNNWFQDGVNHRDRGFTASYAQTGGRAAYTVFGHLTVEAELSGRAWLFTVLPGATATNYRMPSSFLAVEPRARLKYDGTSSDPMRLGLKTGVAAWVEAGVDGRAFSRPFGGFEGEAPEKRNNVPFGALPRRISARGFTGIQVLRVFWVQASGEAGYGADEDDITRVRLGGLNPYSVTMPGAGWGEFLAERYLAAHLEGGITPVPWLYTGISAHGVAFNDPRRVGDLDEVGVLRGLAAEARLGLQGYGVIHVRSGGNMDVRRAGGTGGWSAFMWLELWWPR